MNKYRIYATILGYVLPEEETIINYCVIKKMSLEEQRKRKFAPLRNNRKEAFNNIYYKSYITYPSNSDFREVKTKYIICTDIEEYKGEKNKPKDTGGYHGEVNSALGIAIRRFDRVIGLLCLCSSDLLFREVNRYLSTKYDYQICKIYEIKDGKEVTAEKPFMGGWGGMINFPGSRNSFEGINFAMLNRMLNSKNIVFIKSLRYLLSAVKGFHRNLPMEKIFIDYVKCIELIIKSFKGKGFAKQLDKASKILELSSEYKKEIKAIWNSRCSGDFAHANKSLISLYLPPQFPEPSDSEFRGVDLFEMCSMLILKYFKYIDNEFEIILNDDHLKYIDKDNYNQLIDVNMGEYFSFYTNLSNRKILTPLIKRKVASHFKCKIKDIKLKNYKSNKIVFKILNNFVL